MMRLQILAVVPVAVLLAGCGGGAGSSGVGFATRLAQAEDVFTDLESAPVTPVAQVPTSGSARFSGYAAAVIDGDADDDLVLLGDAEVTADFAAGTVAGTADNFEGGRDSNSVARYDGVLSVDSGTITGSDVNARLAGTLRGGGSTVVFDNPLEGEFRGNPLDGIVLGAEDEVDVNGSASAALILLGVR